MVEQNISQKIPKKERPIKINLRGKTKQRLHHIPKSK